MRRTKIVCTLGPATDDVKVLDQLIKNGMDVARFNFSHGTHEEQQKRMDSFREVRRKYQRPVAMLLDTKGPEIRLGDFADDKVQLERGQTFTLTAKSVLGDKEHASISYPNLVEDVGPGSRILIDDGLVEMIVQEVTEESIRCQVVNDGVISNHKGVNIPGLHLNIPYLSEKDKNDLVFGINNDIDFVAASFVRSGEDIRQLRAFLQENGGNGINIIAKIENGEGIENIDEIIELSDGIMIARGDMGVELPEEEVPVVQKMIIGKVYRAGRQVITATQMLDSMMKNPRPTRAEVTDVANAVYDGTSAVMLSGETAAGKFPVEALETMIRIINRTEEDIDYRKRFFARGRQVNPDVTDAVCHATCTTAYDLNASAIVTVTKSGRSARMISRYRPACQIIGGTTSKRVCRQLNLSWGVAPVLLEEKTDVFDLFSHAINGGKKKGLLQEGDLAVITSGVPIGKSGTTNMIKVETVE
ncbi:MAG: pyruvate kinase [Lachnospiraceae bacterium]|nr:pyruvate kinase [Lachnospiraceae bacterium]